MGNGVQVCGVTGYQDLPAIAPDGLGAAIVAWSDTRAGGSDDNVYAQSINFLGSPVWATGGIAICSAPNRQRNPQIVADGLGGAIIVWQDYRSGNDYDIYAQNMNFLGNGAWGTNGVPVCTALNTQQFAAIESNDSGGAIIAWCDSRNDPGDFSEIDIFAQRLDASGSAQWTVDGVAVSSAVGAQWLPRLVSNGDGGAIMAWEDYRDGLSDVYTLGLGVSGVTGVGDPTTSVPSLIVLPSSPNPGRASS